jgi:60 kDa SS-A/Ro ribonucleoprotein
MRLKHSFPFDVSRFIKYAHALGQNWGRAQRRAVSNWYLEQNPSRLAMAITKYQNREGYTHRDILRLAHPCTKDPLRCFIFDYITHGLDKAIENLDKPKSADHASEETSQKNDIAQDTSNKKVDDDDEEHLSKKPPSIDELKSFLQAVEKVKKSTDEIELVAAIQQHHLVHEHMPTTMLNSPVLWSALLKNMPLTAMIRNLGKHLQKETEKRCFLDV